MTDLYAADPLAFATSLMLGLGGLAFVCAAVRALFRLFGGSDRA